MDLQLTGKRALVTGASKGIGKAVARALAAEGCDVVIAARGAELLEVAAAELSAATGRRIIPITVDTGSDESVAALVAGAVEALGGVDILVNSAAKPAGQGAPPKLADITDAVFYDDVNIKVMGYLRCSREVAPHMIAAGWGRIINVSGLGARTTASAVGAIRNVAVAALTKTLADELGPKGINVTVVHPGLTRTEATPGVFAARAAAAGTTVEQIEAGVAASNSIRHFLDADDIARIVAFLASPLSLAINGDAIACGGGQPGVIHY